MPHAIATRSKSSHPVSDAPPWALAILQEIRALRQELRGAGRRRQPLTRLDLTALQRILPAIAGVLGSEPFLSSELLEHEKLRLVCDGFTARSLGRLLRRAELMPVGGYLVQRLSTEAGAVIWRVVAVPEFPEFSTSVVPPRDRTSSGY